ncbi:MAG: hypothetical protein IKV87_04105 [Methanobrevibacter sp.]|nr:hypothetical protein [Methanobrevibacter sp.]
MSNSQKDSLEDVSKGNKESVSDENIDSPSNKKTRFTKSKSISEVFKELDSEEAIDLESNLEAEEEIVESSVSPLDADSDLGDSIEEPQGFTEEIESYEEDEMDEIIPIHNEYKDLDESEAFDTESIYEEDLSDSSDLDDYVESIVDESEDISSEELPDSKENLDAISGDISEDDSIDSEDIDQSDEEDFLEEGMKVVKVKSKNPSSDGVLLNKEKGSFSSLRSIEMDSSFIITVLSFIVGLGILIIGIFYLGSSSDRVVDNVLSGETAGLAVFLIIIGLLIIGFSVLRFLSLTKADQSSSILDMFKSIRDIDYDDVKEDNISRDDFESAFSGVFGKENGTIFSNNDGDKSSATNTSDLFDEDDEISEEDIEALYSQSNMKSQKTTSSAQNSTDDSQDFDSFEMDENSIDSDEEMIDFDNGDFDDNADLREDNMVDLEDKYSKYSFDDEEESKPAFKKSVDISKFDNELSEEELEAERRRKREELEEKKRRIIQGTNFDNSLRK